MGALDLTTANQMVTNYTNTRRTLINNTYNINDTKAIWFSIAQVKDYLATLTPDITGVRIYLAAYGDTDPTYPNQTTVIAIGTVAGASGGNVDPISQNATVLPAGGGQDPGNHGSLCPPATDC